MSKLLGKLRFLYRSFSVFGQKREVYNSALRENILVNVVRNKVFKTREKLTVDRFIEKSKEKHGNKFDYSLVKSIKNNRTKVVIMCNCCGGPFIQAATRHMAGDGCYYCSGKYQRNTLSFIKDAIQVHGFEFDYSESVYIDMHTKVKIKHNKCNHEFEAKPGNHIFKKSGCPKCANCLKLTTEEFVKRSRVTHGNSYNYNKSEYKNNSTKVTIGCNKCNLMFTQSPDKHMSGTGCPYCCESKGEREIARFLTNNNIEFIKQYGPDGCVNIKQLYFDFYLPKLNILIEYDGEQHYKAIPHFGGERKFNKLKNRDRIKSNWSVSNNKKLYRIRFDQDLLLELKDILKKEN